MGKIFFLHCTDLRSLFFDRRHISGSLYAEQNYVPISTSIGQTSTYGSLDNKVFTRFGDEVIGKECIKMRAWEKQMNVT